MTGETDYPPRFDYPLEYLNIAALGLLVGLTQAFIEPATVKELADRLERPMSEEEFEERIGPHRELFGIDEGVRFMQGPEPERDGKGRLKKLGELGEILLTVKKGDKEFLNRPALDWCVRLDQIPLLLFSRSTFYEKSAGRGYLTGTTGDLEIRTFIIDPESLRRTIWLNVLTSAEQVNYFRPAGSGKGYDDWMWNRLPDAPEVPQGEISLRSGLFWTVANLWMEIQELEEPRRCVLSGDVPAPGDRAGTGVAVTSTGIGFGATVERDDGLQVRQSFFRHPNAPYKTISPKNKPDFTTHIEVREKTGLIGEMGGLFYATGKQPVTVKGNGVKYHIAPTLRQLYALHEVLEEDDDLEISPRYDLLCFGFNMLSSKKNVHGGYETEQFSYPILGSGAGDRTEAMEEAEKLLNKLTEITDSVENTLRRCVQICLLEGTQIEENESGNISISLTTYIDDSGPIRDAARELWRNAGEELRAIIRELGTYRTADEIGKNSDLLRNDWTDRIARHAERIFYRYFNDAAYSRSPDFLIAAHTAKGIFNGGLAKIDANIFKRRKLKNKPNPVEEGTDG